MSLVSHEYVSEYGWSVCLPDGWKRLEDPAGETAMEMQPLVVARPIAFASRDDMSSNLVWMVLPSKIDEAVLSAFATVTMLEGSVSPEEAKSVCDRLWPTIGVIVEASVVRLPDNRYALEVIETFSQDASAEVKKSGYQLIFSVPAKVKAPPMMQRLCFYAPENRFYDAFEELKSIAHSFKYVRPFGEKE